MVQVFSFKLRGAYNKMANLTAEQREMGVITSSAGNHAQGVSLAASRLVSLHSSVAKLDWRSQPVPCLSQPSYANQGHMQGKVVM